MDTDIITIPEIVKKQREFFFTHKTKNVSFRLEMLKRLQKSIKSSEKEIAQALNIDLRKSEFEVYATEIGIILEEIRLHIQHLKSWSSIKQVKTPTTLLFSKSFVLSEPFGVTLIMSPWNYPFQLLMAPLIGAISAGNCVILKPSEISENTAQVIEKIIKNTFESSYIHTFLGGKEVNQAILKEKYDYVFFTGGPVMGRIVMDAASRHLTPITLELGGKTPCIVEPDARLDVAAKRIMWGKFLNAGQTCVAPDYLLVNRAIKNDLLPKMKSYINSFYGEDPQKSPDYPRIVSQNHFLKLIPYLKDGKIYTGGKYDEKDRYIEPTIITDVDTNMSVMQEEIFGPILPVIEYENIAEAINFVNERPKPLAQYLFTESIKTQHDVLKKTSFGGGCINDTIVHLVNPNMSFGGVGSSGMGGYHGKKSFDTFSHFKSILKSSTLLDNPIKYAPYRGKLRFLKLFLK
ncbi:MAG: aldehyde dehydrogenase [Desulfobacterales bacterium]|nr:aldehyde dehydrogenase [Desulfobacterales bacterium]